MIRTLLITVFINIFFIAYSQEITKTKEKGDKYYSEYSYRESIKKYEAVKEKDINLYRKLAISYYNIANYEKSEENWEKVVADEKHKPEDDYNYAAVLAINKKYAEADEYMRKFHSLNKHDSRAKLWTSHSGFYKILQKNKGIFTIENLLINSKQQDFGTSYFKDKIVFASSREKKVKLIKRIWNWNKLPYLDIYIGDLDSNKHIKKVERFRNHINKRLHEGPASFNKAGDFMVFTRNNYEGRSEDGIVKLKLFSSKYKDDKWQEPQPFSFNSSEYSVGHATLTQSGDTMYFVSDMPGGYGGTDIYRTHRKADGSWTEPKNLGSTINTEGNEMFPFIHPEGILFFASNGLPGLGGLDIFLSNIKDGELLEPENIGVPINSSYDDFAFIIDQKQKTGYFSSNRPEGHGDDDIYVFKLLKPFKFRRYLRGKTYDSDSNILANVKVILFAQNGDTLQTLVTADDGKYEFEIESDKIYDLTGQKIKYIDGINSADSHNDDPIIYADLVLRRMPDFSLHVVVTDANNGKPINGVEVKMTDYMKDKVDTFITVNNGDFFRYLVDNKMNDSLSYDFKLRKSGYMPTTYSWQKVLDHEGQYDIYIQMDTMIHIPPIYFDYDKSNIRRDAAVRLKEVVSIMNKYPTIVIELGSHTDCRGTQRYNMGLSNRRAKSSTKYIRDRVKYKPERIYGKGYGETQLTNGCACEGKKRSNCNEEQHQLNRRTEFKIVKFNEE